MAAGNDWGSAPPLARLARQGIMWSVGQSVTATALLNGIIVLWNTGSTGLSVWVTGILITSSAPMSITVYKLGVDPLLAAGNTPVNLLFGGGASGAKVEAAAVATPAQTGEIADLQVGTGGATLPLGGSAIVLNPGAGIMIASAAVAGVISANIVWIEQ